VKKKKWEMQVKWKRKEGVDEDAWWEECDWCDGAETERIAERGAEAYIEYENQEKKEQRRKVLLGVREAEGVGIMKIERVSREVVDGKLLVALDDESKVAIVVTEEDLNMLIGALEGVWDCAKEDERIRMLQDLGLLRKEAFEKKVVR